MSAAAEAHEQHGPPPIHYSSRISPSVLGMFLFIGSEIMLFGSFFTVYFFDRVVNHGVNGHWPPPGFHRPAFVAGINTAILVTSSFTMHLRRRRSSVATAPACRRASCSRSCSDGRSF